MRKMLGKTLQIINLIIHQNISQWVFIENIYLLGGFSPTPLKQKLRQNGFIFPNFRGENQKIIEVSPPRYPFKGLFNIGGCKQLRGC